MNSESIQLFRTITEDYNIKDEEIKKFLKWGNDDIQQALNYYYRRIEKSCPSMKQVSQQSILGWGSKTVLKKTESKNQEAVKYERTSEQSLNEVTVFDKMKKASIKQKKTQEFIAKVRTKYQLPVNGKSRKSNAQKSEISQEEDNYEVEQEFKSADLLESVFDKSASLIDNESQEEIDEFQDYSMHQELKQKIQEIKMETVRLSANTQSKTDSYALDYNGSSFEFLQKQQQPKKRPKRQLKPKNVQTNLLKPKTRNHSKNITKPPKPQPMKQLYDQKPSFLINEIQRPKLGASSQTKDSQKKVSPIPHQVYIGEYFFQGFKTDTKPFPEDLRTHEMVDYKYYMQPEKKSKSIKSKSTQKLINMRICFAGSEICRVQDHQARILVPLITQNMIRLQVVLHELPLLINTFSKLKLIGKVYLKKKAITEPVVQTFDGQSEEIVNIYKGVREELSGLLQRIDLKIKKYPLIKNKSKFTKSNINSNKSLKDSSHFQNKAMEFLKKEQDYAQRKQNDPFFKVKQVNIADMIKKNENENSSSFKKQRQKTPSKQAKFEQCTGSEVKKKVIEINTIEENKFAQLIDLYEESVDPVYPTHNFKSELYHYQAIALAWMLKREGKKEVEDFYIEPEMQEIHPLWTEYELPQDEFGTERSLYYNELTAQLSLKRPIMKDKCKGGILADEMGLGKTVMMTSLIASGVEKNLKKNECQNLVIVPLTLLSQWESQIKKHSKNINVVCYYTSERHKLIEDLGRYNVVITTYGTVSHQFTKLSKFNKAGLYRYKWKRIILDEAHYIKGRIIQTSKAVYNLESECRWCLTGTPIQNGLNDLFSLLHFIRYSPWSEFQCWSKYIIKPHENGDENVYEVLRTLLKKVFLRRTKNSKDQNGKSIIELPKKYSKIEVLQMSPKQREFYDMIYDSTKKKIDELDKLGIITARYMQVLQILVKLRQVCCHHILFKSVTKFIKNPQSFEAQLRKFIKKRQAQKINEIEQSENYFEPIFEGQEEIRVEISQETNKVSETFLRETIEKVNRDELGDCLICMDNLEDPVITSCLHIFCKTCAIRQIQESGTCATCRKRITKEDFLHLPRQNRFNVSLDSENFTRSTKMIALMQHIKKMKPDDKAVVFSQFLGMLDLLQHDFKKHNIRFVRMEGSTPQKERAKIISEFSNNPQVKIFLVSLKTAGVGLNLVAANKVFLMDPWWNPGVEDQAIERVHRIGQKKEVQVVRFIMEKTIEMRMLELNNEKKNLSQIVLSHKDNEGESKLDKLRYLMEKY